MPIDVEQLSGEPIALVTGRGKLTMDELEEAFQQIAALADRWGTTINAVYDFDRIDIPWATALAGMNLTVKKLPGSPTDERVHTVVVGTSDLVRTAVGALGKSIWGGLDIKMFGTVNEALGYTRSQMASGG